MAKTTATRPPTFDHLKKKKPLEVVVPIHHDDTLVHAYEVASEALGKAQLLDQETAELEAKKAEAEAALRAETTFLTFRSIGRKAYEALLREHPATDEQKKAAKEQELPEPPYNQETFSVALVAACCVDPESGKQVLTEEEVGEIFDEWNSSEIVALWTAAMSCNIQRRVTDLGNF